jgi:hypothetical protein
MTRAITLILLATLAALAADEPNRLTKQEKKEGFRLLFDGKSLQGWDGDPRLWSVKDGEMIGSTEGVTLQANTFLRSMVEYGDFELRLQLRLRNHNSGIQFRSEALPDYVVKGLQADAAENAWWGSIYDEKGTRGVMVNGWKGKAETVVKAGDWNDYVVRCEGAKIRLTVNGLVTAELEDTTKLRGILALQLHRGPAMEARFRSIRIKTLDGK